MRRTVSIIGLEVGLLHLESLNSRAHQTQAQIARAEMALLELRAKHQSISVQLTKAQADLGMPRGVGGWTIDFIKKEYSWNEAEAQHDGQAVPSPGVAKHGAGGSDTPGDLQGTAAKEDGASQAET